VQTHQRHFRAAPPRLGLFQKNISRCHHSSFLLRSSTIHLISPPLPPINPQSSVDLELPVMASKMLMRPQPLRCARPLAQAFSSNSSGSFASVATCGVRQGPAAKRPLTAQIQRSAIRQPFRRQYADNRAPEVTLSPAGAAKPKRRWRFFRTIWRITYLSVLATLGYTAYTVWDLRNPNDQLEPDPSKKTLVILGALY